MHADQKLYLVFEFLDVDLKRYMDNGNKNGRPITSDIVKVSVTLSIARKQPCIWNDTCLIRVHDACDDKMSRSGRVWRNVNRSMDGPPG